MNICILSGRLGKDPEIRVTQGGMSVAKFSIAVETSSGRVRTNIVAFGKTAEIVGQYLKKGGQVAVEAEFENDTYEKDGEKKSWPQFLANRVHLLDGKGEKQEPRQKSPIINDNGFDDSIPF